MIEWIDCKDRLPNKDEIVLFYCDNEYHIGYFHGVGRSGNAIWQTYIDSSSGIDEVEFWSRLEKPK